MTKTKQNKANVSQTRTIKQKPKTYKSFRLSKKLKHPSTLPKARNMFTQTCRLFWDNRRVFSWVIGLFFVLTIVFVQGLQATNEVDEIKLIIEDLFDGATGQFFAGITVLSILSGSVVSASSDVAGVYQTILLILMSLATIYALRKIHAKGSVNVHEVFYNSTYPLVPFLLTLFVVGLQLIPLAIGGWLFSTVTVAGLAIHPVEQLMWATIFFLLAVLSLYMITSSIFALYIVTLPDMRPMQSLRSARKLVRLRRWEVLRKLLFLPFALLIIGAVVLLPIAILITPIAEYVVLLYFLLSVLFSYGYVYELYRELL